MDLTLPLDNAAIEKILLHRYPFSFVDRIEFEVDKRIVGIRTSRTTTVSLSGSKRPTGAAADDSDRVVARSARS
jgi:hypothetical protein